MRSAAALLLLCVPAAALAQAAKPPAPATPTHQPAAAAPAHPAAKPHPAPAHKPAKPGAKPAAHAKPAPAPAKPPPPTEAPPAAEAPAAPPRGRDSGLPIPRFAALKTDDVNFRRGPGAQYPIEWVYKRHDLPVEIEREFENYRLVRSPDGTRGWVHQATLTGRRTAVIDGGPRVLRQAGAETAAAVANLKQGVIVRLRSCAAGSDWCEVQVGEYRGFLKRSDVWGLLPAEVIQ